MEKLYQCKICDGILYLKDNFKLTNKSGYITKHFNVHNIKISEMN